MPGMKGLAKLVGVITATVLGLAILTAYEDDRLDARTKVMGYPVISIAQVGAKGWIAIGQGNIQGVLTYAQAGFGVVTFAQGGVGLIFGVGQAMAGLVAIAQIGVGVLFFFGQLGAGVQVHGQLVLGIKIKDYLSEMNDEFNELLSFRRPKQKPIGSGT